MSTEVTRPTDTSSSSKSIDLAAIEAELNPLSSDKLKARFLACFQGASQFLAEAAICLKLLEDRGFDVKRMEGYGTFRRIAAGQILPELVWLFARSPNLGLVERLPLPDQKALVRDPMVEVVQPVSGGYTTRKVDIRTAPKEVAKLALGPDGRRSPEEQVAYLGAQKTRPRPPAERAAVAEVSEPLVRTITVRLTETELENVKLRAAYAHKRESEIIRQFLVRSGAFERPKSL